MAHDRLSATLSALADPTRRAILARLADGRGDGGRAGGAVRDEPAGGVAAPEGAERAGLIARGREAQWRPCRLEPEPLREVAGWLETYRRFWEASFDRLDDYLNDLQKGNPDGRDH